MGEINQTFSPARVMSVQSEVSTQMTRRSETWPDEKELSTTLRPICGGSAPHATYQGVDLDRVAGRGRCSCGDVLWDLRGCRRSSCAVCCHAECGPHRAAGERACGGTAFQDHCDRNRVSGNDLPGCRSCFGRESCRCAILSDCRATDGPWLYCRPRRDAVCSCRRLHFSL